MRRKYFEWILLLPTQGKSYLSLLLILSLSHSFYLTFPLSSHYLYDFIIQKCVHPSFRHFLGPSLSIISLPPLFKKMIIFFPLFLFSFPSLSLLSFPPFFSPFCFISQWVEQKMVRGRKEKVNDEHYEKTLLAIMAKQKNLLCTRAPLLFNTWNFTYRKMSFG